MAPLRMLNMAAVFFAVTQHVVSPKCIDGATRCPGSCQCRIDPSGGIAVNCRGASLSALPGDLPTNTSTLILNRNSIHATSRNDLAQCHALRYLDLSENKMAKIGNDSFRDVLQLETLLLQSNQLSFNPNSVPLGLFDPLHNLSILNIMDNKWDLMDALRYDIFKGKPHLQDISFDIPLGLDFFDDAMASLTSLKTLRISGGLKSVKNQTFAAFGNLSVTDLTITGTKLTQIEMLAFSHFPRIRSLDLSKNEQLGLGKDRLWQKSWYGLQHSNLTVLNLNQIVNSFDYNPYSVPENFCQYLNNTPLKELYLDVNGLVKVNVKFSKCFPQLQKLSLAYNRLMDNVNYIVIDAAQMTHIQYLDMSMQSKFPTAQTVSEVGNVNDRHDHNLVVYFAPSLLYANLSYAFPASYQIINDIYWFCKALHMENIDVSGNKMDEIVGHIIPYPNRTIHFGVFNLSDCGLQKLANHAFPPVWRIHTVDLHANRLDDWFENDIDGNFLERLNRGNCRELNIASNGIKSLPPKFLSQIETLEHLVVRDNALSVWETSVVTIVNLTFVDLADNLIPYLEIEFRKELDDIADRIPLQLNLAGNPLECECHSLAFLRWIKSTKVHIIGRDNYTCHMSGSLVSLGNLTQIVDHLTIQCSSKTWVKVTGLLCVVLVLLIFVAVLVYRYRWDIRYCVLKFRRQRHDFYALADERDFSFNAFVAYHQDELPWIQHELIPNLEHSVEPLSLCIHHRNWLPGPTIEENISYSVENCRKTLALISPSFMRSGWCEFELEMARLRGFEEGQQIIVIVALEEVPTERMSRTLINLRRTHVWLDWFEHEDDREQFWSLLRGALRAPV